MRAVAYGLRAALMSALMKASSQRSLLSAFLFHPETQTSSEAKTSRFALKNTFSFDFRVVKRVKGRYYGDNWTIFFSEAMFFCLSVV